VLPFSFCDSAELFIAKLFLLEKSEFLLVEELLSYLSPTLEEVSIEDWAGKGRGGGALLGARG
jgi:hypothetical protein